MTYPLPCPVGRSCNGGYFSGKTGKKKIGWYDLLKEREIL
jgi:hypothetical protein